jgi:hypothetical protein
MLGISFVLMPYLVFGIIDLGIDLIFYRFSDKKLFYSDVNLGSNLKPSFFVPPRDLAMKPVKTLLKGKTSFLVSLLILLKKAC